MPRVRDLVVAGAWAVTSGRCATCRSAAAPVLIRLAMRRFVCQNAACAKVTFAGQADGLTARYQRWSVPLAGLLAQVALELAGRAGARLARALGIAVHRGTLLRLVIDLPEPAITAAPEALGVDDVALRRGHVYATILVDAATGQAIDILPGREAAGRLAQGASGRAGDLPRPRWRLRRRRPRRCTGGGPGRRRWHLWHNLAEHTARTVARHRACLKQIAAAADQPQPPAAGAETLTEIPAPDSRLAVRMRDQHAAVQALAARGLSLRAIARELGADRKTVRRFAHATTSDEAVARAISRPTVLDRYQPHLHRRWNEGCHDAAVLHAEITVLGYRGSLRTVYRYLQPLRTGTNPAALTPAALKIGEVTSWLLRRAEDLSPRQQQMLADVRGHCSQLDRLAEHVTSFAKMMTKRTGDQELASWLERVDADDQPELHTFATGIRQDLAAVTAGLSLPYSSGTTEGNVNRLKAIKRQMYGRASLDLLRKRVIHHPP